MEKIQAEIQNSLLNLLPSGEYQCNLQVKNGQIILTPIAGLPGDDTAAGKPEKHYKIADGRIGDFAALLGAMLKTSLIVEVDSEGQEHRVKNVEVAGNELCTRLFGEPIKHFYSTYSKAFNRSNRKRFFVFQSLQAFAEHLAEEIDHGKKPDLR